MRDPLIQAEMRHLAAKYGPTAAESELDERYQEQHDKDRHEEGNR